jgi:hypothetical protein
MAAMSERDDGGPAFPMVNELGVIHHPGMSLRDAYAMQALTGLHLKHDGLYSDSDRNDGVPKLDAQWVAQAAYRYADAMLEARKK